MKGPMIFSRSSRSRRWESGSFVSGLQNSPAGGEKRSRKADAPIRDANAREMEVLGGWRVGMRKGGCNCFASHCRAITIRYYIAAYFVEEYEGEFLKITRRTNSFPGILSRPRSLSLFLYHSRQRKEFSSLNSLEKDCIFLLSEMVIYRIFVFGECVKHARMKRLYSSIIRNDWKITLLYSTSVSNHASQCK